jgi:Fic family protein
LAVSSKGEWDGWLTFFLRGVREQAADALHCAHQLLELHSEYRQKIEGKHVPLAAAPLVDHLFRNPIISIAHLSKEWGMSYPTLRKGVTYLEDKGVLKEMTGRARNRLYVAKELYDLVAKPYSRRT